MTDISVVMPAYNEGDLVRQTCDAFRRNLGDDAEIIVVDDGSDDGSCDALGHGVCVIRNDRWRGVSKARNQGWRASRGAVVVFVDAHLKIWRGRVAELCERALETGHVGVAASTSWDDMERYTYYGARFWQRPDGSLHVAWETREPEQRFEPRQALNGMCYAFPRSVLERIGGWIDCYFRWGYNEPGMSLKLWFAGESIFVDRDTLVGHYYKVAAAGRRSNFVKHRRDIWFNALAMLKICFDPATFWLYWCPHLARHRWTDGYYAMLRQTVPEEEAFRQIKTRRDWEFFEGVLSRDLPYVRDAQGNVLVLRERIDPQRLRSQAKDCAYSQRTRELLDWFERLREPEWDGWRCLDVGTRDGGALVEMTNRGAAKCIGLELVPESVERCVARGLHAETGSVEDMSRWPDKHFDLVLCEHVLEHTLAPRAAVAEMCRVAKRFVVIEVPRETVTHYEVGHMHRFTTEDDIFRLCPSGWITDVVRRNGIMRICMKRGAM